MLKAARKCTVNARGRKKRHVPLLPGSEPRAFVHPCPVRLAKNTKERKKAKKTSRKLLIFASSFSCSCHAAFRSFTSSLLVRARLASRKGDQSSARLSSRPIASPVLVRLRLSIARQLIFREEGAFKKRLPIYTLMSARSGVHFNVIAISLKGRGG